MSAPARKIWDRHAIRAEIHRRGATLTKVAMDAGLDPSACRVALIRPLASGENAISRFLGVDPQILWPDRYDVDGVRLRSLENSGGDGRLATAKLHAGGSQ